MLPGSPDMAVLDAPTYTALSVSAHIKTLSNLCFVSAKPFMCMHFNYYSFRAQLPVIIAKSFKLVTWCFFVEIHADTEQSGNDNNEVME